MTRAELNNYGAFLARTLEAKGYSLSWYMRQPNRDEIDRKIQAKYYEWVNAHTSKKAV